MPPTSATTPDQFYSGLIAELYEPLASGLPDAAPYQKFIEKYGSPTLELGCGSGLPMLDLLAAGFLVEGLDASADILEVCRSKAEARQLTPVLHHGLFQTFELGKTYKTIYVPSASFTLLTSDDDALDCLRSIRRHLDDDGALFLPLEIFDSADFVVNQFKETADDEGNLLKVGVVGVQPSDDQRNLVVTLRYEKHYTDGREEVVIRDWHRRCWNEEQITTLLTEAGFDELQFTEGSNAAATNIYGDCTGLNLVSMTAQGNGGWDRSRTDIVQICNLLHNHSATQPWWGV